MLGEAAGWFLQWLLADGGGSGGLCHLLLLCANRASASEPLKQCGSVQAARVENSGRISVHILSLV